MIAALSRAGAVSAWDELPAVPRAAGTVLRLAQGLAIPDGPCDWTLVFGIALQERCAVLAWARSAPTIRAHAPADVTARWRLHALEKHAYAQRQLHVVSATVAALRTESVDPVVLKGLPLASRLYGDFAVRACVDIDLYVPRESRAKAEAALARAGWTLAEGEAPWTQAFVCSRQGDHFDLEVHSSIVDLNLRHLQPRPPRAASVAVAEAVLPVLQDPIEPAYLAAHAAKHMPVALLYYLDFRALWSSLDAAEREAATAAARETGLLGYLHWMQRRSAAVAAATDGDAGALHLLGVGAEGRTDTHAAFRDLLLARSPLAAVRSFSAWVWPPNMRQGWAPFLDRCRHRLAAPWRKYIAKGHRYRSVGGR